MADQPPRAEDPKETTTARQPAARRWPTASASRGRPPSCRAARGRGTDSSNPVIAVDHDACILCDRCVRACDDIQGNDVIGRSGKGYSTRIAFDLERPDGRQLLRHLRRVRAGLPDRRADQQADPRHPDPRRARSWTPVDSVCPYCGVGCALTYYVDRERGAIAFAEGRDQPGIAEPAVREGPLRLGLRGLAAAADHAADPHATRVLPEGRRCSPRRSRRRRGRAATAQAQARRPRRLRRGHAALPRGDLGGGARPRRAPAAGDPRRSTARARIAGFGSAKCSNEEAYLFQKLIRAGFGTNNVDHCTRLCHASSVRGAVRGRRLRRGVHHLRRRRSTPTSRSSPAPTRPRTTRWPRRSSSRRAARGTKLIVRRPARGRRSPTTPTSSCQLKPGTDVAFYNARHARGHPARAGRPGVHREPHRRTSTRWRKHGRRLPAGAGRADHAASTPTRSARSPGSGARPAPAIIFWGMGISQHTTGTDNARCLIALCSITGNVGRPGTGLHPLRGQNNVQGASDAGLIPMFYPDYQRRRRREAAREVRGGLGRAARPEARADRHRDHRVGAAAAASAACT